MKKELSSLRCEIDEIDKNICQSIAKRMAISKEIGAIKQTDASVFRPKREAQLITHLLSLIPSELDRLIPSVWRAIISASIAVQKPDFTIGYSDDTKCDALLFASGQLKLRAANSPSQAVEQLSDQRCDMAILSANDIKQIAPILGPKHKVMIIAGLPSHLTQDTHSHFIIAPSISDEMGYNAAVYFDAPRDAIEIAEINRYEDSSDIDCLGFLYQP